MSKNLTDDQIKEHEEYIKAKKDCRQAIRQQGGFTHQVLGYTVKDLANKLGVNSVKLLVSEVPEIDEIISIDYSKL